VTGSRRADVVQVGVTAVKASEPFFSGLLQWEMPKSGVGAPTRVVAMDGGP
jgi:hypothetical protein